MQKKFRISVDDRTYTVAVEEIMSDIPAAAPVMSAPVVVASSSPVAARAAAPLPAAGKGDEVAPLAGVVVSINVQVGQAVSAGDNIVTLEAMKMKTDVFAKHSGKVVSIVIKPHDSVDTGQVLLTLA